MLVGVWCVVVVYCDCCVVVWFVWIVVEYCDFVVGVCIVVCGLDCIFECIGWLVYECVWCGVGYWLVWFCEYFCLCKVG